LSPSLIRLQKLQDVDWWGKRLTASMDINTTDATHSLEILLETVHVVESAVHGRLSEEMQSLFNSIVEVRAELQNHDDSSVKDVRRYKPTSIT